MNETSFTDFKAIINQNTILRRAYGYNESPDYTMSVHMITYADVQTDIFQLNKYGHIPNAEIEFNFDKIDFACALATKCGQLKEYQLEKDFIYCKMPSSLLSDDAYDTTTSTDTSYMSLSNMQFYSIGASPYTGQLSDFQPSAIVEPNLMQYHCQILTGWCNAGIELHYKYGKEYTVPCNPYQHTDFNVSFPANEDLYRSLKYKIQNDEYLETKLYLTYVINPIKVADGSIKNVLSGYVHGSLLFFDINMVGKYVNLIRPSIGDLIAIDFPDDANREMYEVTDCFDKQLTQDGISPLLHNYIWKCKAKRYVNAHEDNAPTNEADERVEEQQRYDQLVDGIVTDQISMYDTLSGDVKEDSVYGGYDSVIDKYDNKEVRPTQELYDYLDDGTGINLMVFKQKSKLITNGYDLIFINKDNEACNITTKAAPYPTAGCVIEQDLRWLKATDNQIVFVDIEGVSTAIAFNGLATQDELEICVNSLYDKTLDTGKPINEENQSFLKFKGTRSYLWSDGMHLFAKLASSKDLYFIA